MGTQSELELFAKQQKSYVDILLKAYPSVLFITDTHGSIFLTTDYFVKAAGADKPGALLKHSVLVLFNDFLNDENYARFSNAVTDIMVNRSSQTLDLTCTFPGINGGTGRLYSLEISVLKQSQDADEKGLKDSLLFVMTDITDVTRAHEQTQQAHEGKSEFLTTMSHEIRTPMNTIIGMGELLSRTELERAQRKYLDDILTSSKSLLVIINDILDFSDIEAGKLEIVNTYFDLTALLNNLYYIFNVALHAKDISLDFQLGTGVPNQICGDEIRLRQVLANLLSNANKYTLEGSVAFSASVGTRSPLQSRVAKEALSKLEQEGPPLIWLTFVVKDTGIGIKRTKLAKLFTPFEQLDLRKNRSVEGTGLGLAIAKRLCEMMGGSLEIESVYSEGTTCTVCIPFKTEASRHTAAEPETPNASMLLAPNARVLVVDDMVINLAVAEAMLETFSINPDKASSGNEALRLASRNTYDLIFMDHMMPEMDGITATKNIRSTKNPNSNTPIIALTANVVSGMRERYLKNGFDDFLPKPLELGELNHILSKWLTAEVTGTASLS